MPTSRRSRIRWATELPRVRRDELLRGNSTSHYCGSNVRVHVHGPRCLERGRTIRLVVLEPGDFNDSLRCSLILSDLQSYTDYNAISYTWATEDGDDAKTEAIYVDDSTFYATKNCAAALRNVRQFQVRRVWIDAMCINQSNVKERNHQDGLMDQIYRQATCVHVCVDNPGADFAALVTWLQQDHLPNSRVPAKWTHVASHNARDKFSKEVQAQMQSLITLDISVGPGLSKKWLLLRGLHYMQTTSQSSYRKISWTEFMESRIASTLTCQSLSKPCRLSMRPVLSSNTSSILWTLSAPIQEIMFTRY